MYIFEIIWFWFFQNFLKLRVYFVKLRKWCRSCSKVLAKNLRRSQGVTSHDWTFKKTSQKTFPFNSNGEVLDLGIYTHFPDTNALNGGTIKIMQLGIPNSENWLELAETKIRWAINSFMPYKSPGGNGLYLMSFRNLSVQYQHCYLVYYEPS